MTIQKYNNPEKGLENNALKKGLQPSNHISFPSEGPDVSKKLEEAIQKLNTLGELLLPDMKVLKGIYNKNVEFAINNHQPPIHSDLYSLLGSEELLTLAYAKIGKNKGATTPGPTGLSADEMSAERIRKFAISIQDGSFKWKPYQLKNIPKPGAKPDPITGKAKERPLGIPEFEDRLVQEVIRLILQAIYEPWWEIQKVSYGFRPHKSTHDALQHIYTQAQATNYAIEGDIQGAFDFVNPEILGVILRERISDKRFIGLIKSGFRAGKFNDIGQLTDTLLGTPQGGIASPILFNIYLSKMDNFVMNTIKPYIEEQQVTFRRAKPVTKSGTELPPTEWEKLNRKIRAYQQRIHRHQRGQSKNTAAYEEAIRELPKLTYQRTQIPKSTATSSAIENCRMCYVRYADDFVIFTNADKRICEKVKETLSNFLQNELGLTLSPTKTTITDIRKDRAHFLGFEIHRKFRARERKIRITHPSRKPENTFRPDKNNHTDDVEDEISPDDPNPLYTYQRANRNSLIFTIDQNRLLSRMNLRRYCTKTGWPIENSPFSVLSLQEIVMKYNSVMLGLAQYYFPILTCRSHLNRWIYILYYSCLKTMSQKIRKSSRKITKDFAYLDISIPTERKKRFHNERRIVIKYEQDGKQKYAVLLNYHEVMARCRITRYNAKIQKILKPTVSSDFLVAHKIYWRTSFKLTTCCAVCGSTEKIQNHHIRHLANRNKAKGFKAIMAQLQRRQIPLCKNCHNLVHSGKYDGISLSDLYDTRVATCENLINSTQSPWVDPEQLAKKKYGSNLIKITTNNAYFLDESRKTITSGYLKAALELDHRRDQK